jgi:hypothetical protein
MCRRGVEGGTQKRLQRPREVYRRATKIPVSVQLKCGGGTKMETLSSRTVQGGSQKMASFCRLYIRMAQKRFESVSSRSVLCGIQKMASECRRNNEGGTQKSGICPGELSKAADKNFVSV